MATLYLNHGIVGSGKTTFAKKFCEKKGVLRLCNDEFMITLYGENPTVENRLDGVEKLLRKLASDLLQNNIDVFLDAGVFRRKSRDDWRALAKENNADCVLFFIDCPKEVALQRTLNRTKDKNKDAYWINEEGFYIINQQVEPLGDDEEFVLVQN